MVFLPWKFLFIILLTLGSVIAVSAPSWFAAWIGLEVNMAAVLAVMMDNKSSRNAEAAIKYFLIQALASSLLIISAFFTPSLMFLENISWSMVFIFLSLMMKMGSAPFHFWLPQVVEGLSWFNSFIVLFWQKVAPFVLCIWCLYNPIISLSLNLFICLSALVGAFGGLAQSSLRKILSFSSINHLGWMLLALKINLWAWISYFFLYAVILSLVLIHLAKTNLTNLSSAFMIQLKDKMAFCANFFSLGGLPPFMGFLPKWIIIVLGSNPFPDLILILIMSSLITLLFYLRVVFNFILRKSFVFPHQKMTNNSSLPSNFIIINFMGLILTTGFILQL